MKREPSVISRQLSAIEFKVNPAFCLLPSDARFLIPIKLRVSAPLRFKATNLVLSVFLVSLWFKLSRFTFCVIKLLTTKNAPGTNPGAFTTKLYEKALPLDYACQQRHRTAVTSVRR